MPYRVCRIDAFTGRILHRDGSGRAKCVGDSDAYFFETFDSRDLALQRKDELLQISGVTEVLVSTNDGSEWLVFRNAAEIERIIANQQARLAAKQE